MKDKQYENGERLTINNANKEQLKWLYRDLESRYKNTYKELEQKEKDLTKSQNIMVGLLNYIMENFGEKHTKKAMESVK